MAPPLSHRSIHKHIIITIILLSEVHHTIGQSGMITFFRYKYAEIMVNYTHVSVSITQKQHINYVIIYTNEIHCKITQCFHIN